MEQDIWNYLRRLSTKPLMRISFTSHHISGRIYGIGTPKATHYRYTISFKGWGGRSISIPVNRRSNTDPETVEKYENKGWKWSFICLYNGYEIDCLEKEEPFEKLPKGNNLVGYVWGRLLVGRDAIEDYMRDNFRGFNDITVYRVPEKLL